MRRTSIFLSYARNDDESFVRRLYEDLTARKFEVWFDQVKMPNRGLSFPAELREAIDRSDRFVLVVGPKVNTSDWCRAEWQHSDIFGRPITPIVRKDGERADGTQIDGFELIPNELKSQDLHADDFRDDKRYEENLERLARQLSEPVVPPGKLVGIPALPAHLVMRHDRIQSLREALLSDFQRPVGITGLYGMGGIGKSVVANLLARDPRVRRAFPDGIFWVPLGIEPQILRRQAELAAALGYEASRFGSVEEGRARLGELLAHNAALLVLDDVWTREAAEGFNVLGPKCRAVLTTRDGGLITSLGGSHHQLGFMKSTEALLVLAQASRVDVQALPEEAAGIARCCGNLPLALALSGGLVRRGTVWENVLQRLEQAALERIGDRHPDPINPQHQSISTALQVSVDALPDDERARFLELSVFPLDAEVSEEATRTLWSHTGGLDEFACEDLLVSLRERSLLLSSTAGKIAFHDLVHAFATKRAGNLKRLHQHLLDAYRTNCPDGWSSGPDDGYFLQSLCNHLLAAGRTEEAVALVTDLQWIRAKCHASLVYEMQADCRSVQTALSGQASVPKTNRNRHVELESLSASLGRNAQRVEDDPTLLVELLHNDLAWTLPEQSGLAAQLRLAADDQDRRWLRRSRPPVVVGSPGVGPPVMTMHHDDSVNVVVFSPDGAVLVSAAGDAVHLWNVETGKPLDRLEPSRTAYALAFSADGKMLAAGTYTGTVRLWRLDDGNVSVLHDLSLEGRYRNVNAVAFSPEGETIVAAGHDQPNRRRQRIYLWETESGQLVRTFAGHKLRINALTFSPDGQCLSSVGYDRWLRLWNADSGDLVREIDVGRRSNETVVFSPDGRLIASGGYDKLVRVWDVATGEPLHRLKGHTEKVSSVAFAPDGGTIASASYDDTIRLWSSRTGKLLGVLEGHTGFVHSVTFSPSGNLIASGSWDKRMNLWSVGSPSDARTRARAHTGRLAAVAVSYNAKLCGSGAQDSFARVWEIQSGELRASLKGHTRGVCSIAFSPDDETICTGGRDGKVRIWNPTGELLSTLTGHNGAVHNVAFSPDGKSVASGGDDKFVQLSSTESGQCHSSFEHEGNVRALAFSPSGRTLALGGQWGIRIHDLDGEYLQAFRGHSGWFMAATFSANEKTICAADSLVHLIDVESRNQTRFNPNDWSVKDPSDAMAVAFHPDGNELATGHDDGSVRIWDVEATVRMRNLRGWLISQANVGGRVCFLRWDKEFGLLVGAATGISPALHVFELTNNGKARPLNLG